MSLKKRKSTRKAAQSYDRSGGMRPNIGVAALTVVNPGKPRGGFKTNPYQWIKGAGRTKRGVRTTGQYKTLTGAVSPSRPVPAGSRLYAVDDRGNIIARVPKETQMAHKRARRMRPNNPADHKAIMDAARRFHAAPSKPRSKRRTSSRKRGARPATVETVQTVAATRRAPRKRKTSRRSSSAKTSRRTSRKALARRTSRKTSSRKTSRRTSGRKTSSRKTSRRTSRRKTSRWSSRRRVFTTRRRLSKTGNAQLDRILARGEMPVVAPVYRTSRAKGKKRGYVRSVAFISPGYTQRFTRLKTPLSTPRKTSRRTSGRKTSRRTSRPKQLAANGRYRTREGVMLANPRVMVRVGPRAADVLPMDMSFPRTSNKKGRRRTTPVLIAPHIVGHAQLRRPKAKKKKTKLAANAGRRTNSMRKNSRRRSSRPRRRLSRNSSRRVVARTSRPAGRRTSRRPALRRNSRRRTSRRSSLRTNGRRRTSRRRSTALRANSRRRTSRRSSRRTSRRRSSRRTSTLRANGRRRTSRRRMAKNPAIFGTDLMTGIVQPVGVGVAGFVGARLIGNLAVKIVGDKMDANHARIIGNVVGIGAALLAAQKMPTVKSNLGLALAGMGLAVVDNVVGVTGGEEGPLAMLSGLGNSTVFSPGLLGRYVDTSNAGAPFQNVMGVGGVGEYMDYSPVLGAYVTDKQDGALSEYIEQGVGSDADGLGTIDGMMDAAEAQGQGAIYQAAAGVGTIYQAAAGLGTVYQAAAGLGRLGQIYAATAGLGSDGLQSVSHSAVIGGQRDQAFNRQRAPELSTLAPPMPSQAITKDLPIDKAITEGFITPEGKGHAGGVFAATLFSPMMAG